MELPSNPLSPFYSLLILALPGLWWLGRLLAIRISDTPQIRGLLAFGLALTIWILSVHICGLISESFGIGLVAGTLLPALIGIKYRSIAKAERLAWPGWGLMSLALLGALYLVPTMIQTDIHDKQAIRVSHFSIFNNIANGFYPPRDLVFPDHPLRYHYGVDTMAAMVAALCQARVDVAFNIVTFVGFAFAIAAFGGVGRALFGPRGQLFTGFLCCFHGGFPWPYAKPNQELQERLMGLYFGVQGHWLAPPSTSTVFQMPWSAGYPLFALVLLITTQLSPTRLNIFSSIALTLTLCAVSFCQIAVFLSLGGALLG